MPFLKNVPQRRRKSWLIVLWANLPNVNNTTKRCMKGMTTGCGIRHTAVCVAWATGHRESPCDALIPPVSRWCICGRRNLDSCLTSTFSSSSSWYLSCEGALGGNKNWAFFPPCWGGCSEKNRKTSLNCVHPRARKSPCHVYLIIVTLNSSLQGSSLPGQSPIYESAPVSQWHVCEMEAYFSTLVVYTCKM